MKIEYTRKHKGKEIGMTEVVSDRVGLRFINRGMAKMIIETKPKSNYKRKYKSNETY